MKTLRLLFLLFLLHIFLASGLLAGSISGTIYNGANGKPIAGAKASAVLLSPISSRQFIFSAISDSAGNYKIDSLQDGEYYMKVVATGFLPGQEMPAFKVSGAVTGRDFKLMPVETTRLTLSGSVKEDPFMSPTQSSIPPVKVVYPAKITLTGFSPNGDSVVYSTQNNPDGSYIIKDIKPAIYTVSCEAEGYQKKYIKSVSITYSNITLDIYMSRIFTSFVSGKVTYDKSGLPVENALINIFNSSAMKNAFGLYAYTDKNGNYKVAVPEGKYIISCTRSDNGYYYTEYYDNVQSFADAKILELGASSSLGDINFSIPDEQASLNVSIKGSVKDEGGKPLAYSVIKVWLSPTKDPVMTFAADSLKMFTAVKTDQYGNYEILIKRSATMLNWVVVSAEKEDFVTEFYNNKPSFYLADRLNITKDTVLSGIDFSLTQGVVTNKYSISGVVTGKLGLGLNGGFVIGSSASRPGEITFAITDKDGKYTLPNLKEGKYFLLFAAQGYIPEFYNNAYTWEKAQPVYVNSEITGINATLSEMLSDSGKNFISGIIKDVNGNPLSGALATVMSPSGSAVASAMSDGTGSYQISGLPDGDYTLQVSKVSYQSVSTNVSVNLSRASQVNNISMIQAIVTSVQTSGSNVVPSEIKLIGNYPNPFNPATKISFTLSSSQFTTLTVYNLLGQKITTLLSDKLNAGTHNIDFNAAGLPSGIYLYQLNAGNYSSVKKMILTK